MIVTLTLNTGLDQTLLVPAYEKNRTLRAAQSALSMSGKPACASFVLGTLGIESLALGCIAGAIGAAVDTMLHERGVRTAFTQVDGHSRINAVILDRSDGSATTVTTSTLIISPNHLNAVRDAYAKALDNASVVVLGGTLPPDLDPAIYASLIGMARERGAPTIFDASGPYLSAGLAAQPTFIKPNRHELSTLVGRSIDTVDEAYAAGCEVADRYSTQPVITLDAAGAVAIFGHGTQRRAFFVPPIAVPVVSAAGAGDAVLAGLAASIERGQPIEDGLRLGVAAAAAVCMTLATAECNPAEVERLLPQVKLLPLPPRVH